MQSAAKFGFTTFAACGLISSIVAHVVWLFINSLMEADWTYFVLIFVSHVAGLWLGKFAGGNLLRLLICAVALTSATSLALIAGGVAGALGVVLFPEEGLFIYGALALVAFGAFILMAWGIWIALRRYLAREQLKRTP